MGRSYTVPRSAKGESRILYIFTLKSFGITLLFGVIGFIIVSLIGEVTEVGLAIKVIVTGIMGGIGFIIGSAKIPDSPIMGPLQKAGNEEISDILMRLIFFKNKKKIYLYGLTREKNEVKIDDKGKKGSSLSKLFK